MRSLYSVGVGADLRLLLGIRPAVLQAIEDVLAPVVVDEHLVELDRLVELADLLVAKGRVDRGGRRVLVRGRRVGARPRTSCRPCATARPSPDRAARPCACSKTLFASSKRRVLQDEVGQIAALLLGHLQVGLRARVLLLGLGELARTLGVLLQVAHDDEALPRLVAERVLAAVLLVDRLEARLAPDRSARRGSTGRPRKTRSPRRGSACRARAARAGCTRRAPSSTSG